MIVSSFAPIVSTGATVLILGSMPGSRSLQVGEYYANPHNLFWHFMEEIYAIPRSLPYTKRVGVLQTKKVALWDVLKECDREGSLDADIIPASELPNDFVWLLTTYPTIRRICLNGSKAATAFSRHVAPHLAGDIRDRLTLHPLPSTSPANRTISTIDKLARWRAALE